MSFLEGLLEVLTGQVEKANGRYNQGYDKAERLSDEQLRRRIQNCSNSFEKVGMMQAYKDRHDSDD